MHLHTLTLKNFRNHEHLRLTFSPKVNLILGPNGIGKTNILEAIFLLSTGKSFRSFRLEDLIMQGKSFFYIEAEFYRENVLQTLKLGYSKTKKKIEYNSTSLASFSNLLGIMPAVLYAPKDVALIMGAPDERRKFLNITLSQSDPLYVYHLTRYHKALEARNALLKKREFSTSLIECFEKELSISGAYLMEKRKNHLTLLEELIQKKIKKLSEAAEDFSLSYAPSFCLKETYSQDLLCKWLERSRSKELVLGTTLNGPHKDDFSILNKETPIKNFCSEGQKRSFLNALKLSEWTLLGQRLHLPPLMCLDDLGAHLDASRVSLLSGEIKTLGQVFITSTQETFQAEKLPDVKCFYLKI